MLNSVYSTHIQKSDRDHILIIFIAEIRKSTFFAKKIAFYLCNKSTINLTNSQHLTLLYPRCYS